jgi:hypothetical protein
MQAASLNFAVPNYADWLTTETVATKCGVSALVVNGWIVNGIKTDTGRVRLVASKVGGRWRVEPAALAAFVGATTAAALPESATSATARPVEQPATTAADLNRRGAECMARLRNRGVRAGA